MSLTAGTGPFGERPAGRFNFTPDPPGSTLFWEPFPLRVRAFVDNEPVADSRGVHLLHETGHLPVYYFPPDDVRDDLLVPSGTTTRCPFKGEASYHSLRIGDRVIDDAVWEYREPLEAASFIAGYRAFYWGRVDEWFVEDAQAFGHPRDPYHRIDVYPTTQHVRVLLRDECLADSTRALVLLETGHPPRYYLPLDDVRTDLLEPSDTRTRCAYKGSAAYFSALGQGDVAWTYREPQHDGEPVRDLLAFDDSKVELELDT